MRLIAYNEKDGIVDIYEGEGLFFSEDGSFRAMFREFIIKHESLNNYIIFQPNNDVISIEIKNKFKDKDEDITVLNQNIFGQTGWKCPVCGCGLSPYATICPCQQKFDFTCKS